MVRIPDEIAGGEDPLFRMIHGMERAESARLDGACHATDSSKARGCSPESWVKEMPRPLFFGCDCAGKINARQKATLERAADRDD